MAPSEAHTHRKNVLVCGPVGEATKARLDLAAGFLCVAVFVVQGRGETVAQSLGCEGRRGASP